MANLTLVYGMRLLPEGEVVQINDATLNWPTATRRTSPCTSLKARASRSRLSSSKASTLSSTFTQSS